MGPVVGQLESEFGKAVGFRRYMVDAVRPGTPEYAEMARVMALADFKKTPTLLLVDADGRVASRYEGYTSYLTLRRDLTALRAPKRPS